MKVKIYQIDAFTDKVFSGNPAAVCVLDRFLNDELMQRIAGENNLSETAFVVPKGEDFEIRWFTPSTEVDLCGHATLASAYVLYQFYDYPSERITFHSVASGILTVAKEDDFLTLNFPTDICQQIDIPSALIDAFGRKPLEAYKGKTDYLLIFSSQDDIESIQPNFDLIKTVGGRGVIATAQGTEADFVSRFFAPQAGVNEDPVTGSAHTTLIPIWAKKLNKTKLTAKQLSDRQGELICTYLGDRVEISGKSVTYLVGEIEI